MKKIFQIIYSILIYPGIMLLFHIMALFKGNVRKALRGRYKYRSYILDGLNRDRNRGNLALLHASSMGEFEHIKPLITKLKSEYDIETVVTFFSPSGFENVKEYPGVRFFLYLPFDFQFIWEKVFNLFKPEVLILSKHDVWPNQVWTAEKNGVPTYLINASLSAKSSRTNPLVRFFQKHIYRSLTGIYTVSEEDAKRFATYFPLCNIEVKGDTKFDQVLMRRELAKTKNILPQDWLGNSLVLLFGSVWPEDMKHIYPAIENLISEENNIKVILVPHEPEARFVQSIINRFGENETRVFSKQEEATQKRILIIDKVGVLADLYKYAHVAYVGGSFRQGIHNVMEPAVYGIPVVYGPVHKNAFEATALHQENGSIVVNDETELTAGLLRLVKDETYRMEMGKNAGCFAQRHTGSTDKILQEWKDKKLI